MAIVDAPLSTPDGSCLEWENDLVKEALMHAALDRILARGGRLLPAAERAAIRERGDLLEVSDCFDEELLLIYRLRIGPDEAAAILQPYFGCVARARARARC